MVRECQNAPNTGKISKLKLMLLHNDKKNRFHQGGICKDLLSRIIGF